MNVRSTRLPYIVVSANQQGRRQSESQYAYGVLVSTIAGPSINRGVLIHD